MSYCDSMTLNKYVLTEEGQRYSVEGMPENRILSLLSSETTMKDAKMLSEKEGIDFGVALQWMKQNNWVEMEKGSLLVRKKPKTDKLQEALQSLSKGKDVDKTIISILLKRKLIEEVKADDSAKASQILQQSKELTNIDPSLIKTGLWKNAQLKPYNVTAVGKRVYPGKKHPYRAFLEDTKRKLVKMGFKEMTGPNIELEFWNFDALYQAQNHPSRDWTQTYQMHYPKMGNVVNDKMEKIIEQVAQTHENGGNSGSTGWGYKWNRAQAMQLMPRAHDTAISPRYLSGYADQLKVPGKYFSLVRCYRPDVIDATHGVEFNQLGGFIVDKGLTFRDLLGILKDTVIEISGAKNVRFYPDYYPFTEASVQVSAKHPEMGWVELAGSGIFREELTKPLGIDDTVIAWGFGIDRLAMFKLGIKDIRDLFTRDLSLLRNSKVI